MSAEALKKFIRQPNSVDYKYLTQLEALSNAELSLEAFKTLINGWDNKEELKPESLKQDDLEEIQKLAIQRRLVYALEKITDQQLLSLIDIKPPDTLETILKKDNAFGLQQANAQSLKKQLDWISSVAQNQFLRKKINQCKEWNTVTDFALNSESALKKLVEPISEQLFNKISANTQDFAKQKATPLIKDQFTAIIRDESNYLFSSNALFKLLTSFELETQSTLIKEEKHLVIHELIQAQTKEDIFSCISEAKQQIKPEIIDAIIKENQHRSQFTWIENAKLASIVAGFQPNLRLNLSEPEKDNVNKLLNAEGQDLDINNIQKISDILKIDAMTTESLKNSRSLINQQRIYNQTLRNILQNNPIFKKNTAMKDAILAFLLPLQKDGALIDNELETFFEAINNTSSRKELAQKINPRWGASLTEEIFNTFQKAKRHSNFLSDNYQTQINEDQTLIKNINAAINLAKKQHASFSPITTLKPDVFHPALNKIAKNRSQEQFKHFRQQLSYCDDIISNLSNYEKKLDLALEGIPPDSLGVNNPEIDKHATTITKTSSDLKKQIKHFKEVRETLASSLKYMQEALAKEVTNVQLNSFNTQCTTLPLDKFNDYLKGDPKLVNRQKNPSPPPPLPSTALETEGSYKVGESIQPDTFNNYAVMNNNNDVIGQYLQKIIPGGTEVRVSEFPKEEEDRVVYSFAFVSSALKSLDKPPSKENPLILRSEDPDEAKYIWTALMIIGDRNPDMKFGADAIQVMTSVNGFNPKNEFKRSLFASNSLKSLSPEALYNQVAAFKDERLINQYTKDVIKMNQNQFGEGYKKFVKNQNIENTKNSKQRINDMKQTKQLSEELNKDKITLPKLNS